MPNNKNVLNISRLRHSCRNCAVRELCLPRGLLSGELDFLEEVMVRPRPLRRGQHLYRVGDHMRNLFVVKSGSFKVYRAMSSGDEQIVGFHLPGELLGLEALEGGAFGYSAAALETTSVCELPLARLDDVCGRIPSLHHQINRLIGKQVADDHAMLLVLGRRSAEARLASFLLDLSERFSQRGFSGSAFALSMTRHDIGSYLGLAVETVSRLFTRMQHEGLVSVRGRQVQVLGFDRLRGLVESELGNARQVALPRRGREASGAPTV